MTTRSRMPRCTAITLALERQARGDRPGEHCQVALVLAVDHVLGGAGRCRRDRGECVAGRVGRHLPIETVVLAMQNAMRCRAHLFVDLAGRVDSIGLIDE